MKKSKQEELAHQNRMNFLEVYTNFDKWLMAIGFKQKNTSTSNDYLYSHYGNYVDAMYAVENYTNDFLEITIRFVRDNNIHKFMVVGGLGSYSEVFTIDEFKEIILKITNEKVHEMQEKLKMYTTI